jgi:hypothetical protein
MTKRLLIGIPKAIGAAVWYVAVVAVVFVLAVLVMNRASRRFVGTFHPRF